MKILVDRILKVEPKVRGDFYLQPGVELTFRIDDYTWKTMQKSGEWTDTTAEWKQRIEQFFAEVEEEIKQYKELYKEIQGFAIRIGAKIEHTSDC